MPLMRDVIRGLLKLQGRAFTRQFMIDYYTKTPEGKYEKENSPQGGRDVESPVDDILTDIESEVS